LPALSRELVGPSSHLLTFGKRKPAGGAPPTAGRRVDVENASDARAARREVIGIALGRVRASAVSDRVEAIVRSERKECSIMAPLCGLREGGPSFLEKRRDWRKLHSVTCILRA